MSANMDRLKEAKKAFHKELWVEKGCPPPKYSDYKAKGKPNCIVMLGQWTVNFAKEECPRGVGKGGGLMGSLRFEVEFRDDWWVVTAGTNQKYAQKVEEGQGPHSVDPDDLKLWVKRVLDERDNIDGVAYLVSRKIAKYGIEKHPYLEPGAEKAIKKWKSKYGV